ncbi:MAG: hypothetical protein EXR54_01270 [Dehalococcoidia bacterium]|nr:hypothetical protein [Dehalococcoidia bacterium]MSQ16189.1 hypothetical protein [Dehalococcoidia bacterium]
MSREQYEISWKDYYQVLGVNHDASVGAIRHVWQRLSQIYHPDVAGATEVNAARMQELNEAYEVLSDSQRRAKYDQAYQTRAAEGSAPSGVPAGQQASPPPPPTSRTPPPAAHQPTSGSTPPTGGDGRRGLPRKAKLAAAAGAIGLAALIGISVLPGLLSSGRGPAAPLPSSFSTPTPAPLPTLMLTPNQTETPPIPPIFAPTAESVPPSTNPTPATAPTQGPKVPLLVMSPDAEELGFRGFQVSGNPWMVEFSRECQDAPCLRSGAITGSGVATLRMNSPILLDSVRTVSFDMKVVSPACCTSFRIIMSGISGLKPVTTELPSSASWTRVEVEVPAVRPPTITLEWELWSGPAGLVATDGLWIDNIQFK